LYHLRVAESREFDRFRLIDPTWAHSNCLLHIWCSNGAGLISNCVFHSTGMKKNVLRQRIDSCVFDMDQLVSLSSLTLLIVLWRCSDVHRYRLGAMAFHGLACLLPLASEPTIFVMPSNVRV
jgi:hypothetical protein